MFQEITVQFTEECNVSCPYCFASAKSKCLISDVAFDAFVNFCIQNNPDMIHITGGEPTLHHRFAEYITKLANISSLVIYSNFTTKFMIDNIIVNVPSEIVFLVNITSRLFCTEYQKSNIEINIRRALQNGFRVALSYTFHDSSASIDKEFDELMTMMRKYRLRNLRISHALAFHNQHEFLNKREIKALYHYVAEQIADWKKEGFSVYFDCPVPFCYIDAEDFNSLIKYKAVSIKCIPKAFVMWNLDVTHCYSTMNLFKRKSLMSFSSISEIQEYSSEILKAMKRNSSKYGCQICVYSDNDIPCGCPFYLTENYTGEYDYASFE